MRRISYLAGVVVLALHAARGGAQQLPPVRGIGPIERVSTEPLRAATTVVALSDGRVYVNDVANRRVLLLDSTLSHAEAVADSTSVTAKAYGARPGTLFAFRGDSALFVDPASGSMLVLGPDAKIDRVIAMPRPGTVPFVFNVISGVPGFDANGRLISTMPVALGPQPANEPGKTYVQQGPDSLFVVAFDMVSRAIDTIGAARTGSLRITTVRDANGDLASMMVTQNPVPVVDSWAIEQDGSIAIVRGRDFHVDRLGADGQWHAGPKVAFGWERLSDSGKTALIDSMVAANKARRAAVQAAVVRGVPAGTATADGGVARGGRGGGGGGSGAPPPALIDGRPALSEMADYAPAFGTGAARGDEEGNVWIRTTEVVDGQPVYFVVSGSGVLVDRVQLPAFRAIAGFGRGVVYMAVVDTSGVVHLERAAIRKH